MDLAGPPRCAGPTLALAVVGGLALAVGLTRRVVVEGRSMLPTLAPGDRLLVRRVPARAVRPGDVVAVADPREPGRLLVKRVRAVGPGGLDVRGDNAPESTDSRHLGPLPSSLVRGRVVYRYAPTTGRVR